MVRDSTVRIVRGLRPSWGRSSAPVTQYRYSSWTREGTRDPESCKRVDSSSPEPRPSDQNVNEKSGDRSGENEVGERRVDGSHPPTERLWGNLDPRRVSFLNLTIESSPVPGVV